LLAQLVRGDSAGRATQAQKLRSQSILCCELTRNA